MSQYKQMNAIDLHTRLQQLCENNNPQELSVALHSIESWPLFCAHIYARNPDKTSVLQTAVKLGHMECVKLFDNVVSISDWNAAVETAIDHNQIDILKYVASKAHPQFVEDWSCARASFGDMHAIKSVIPYLSEDGLQAIAYYAASSQEEDVLDYIAQRTNVDATLNWMLAEENIKSDEHEQWLRTKQNELQNLRIAQHLTTPTSRAPRKI